MRTSSCKAKGRRCGLEVKELLHKYAADLKPADIGVTPSGVPGVDVFLSPAAQAIYNFAIECKNVEALNIWKALEQAEAHVKDSDATPILFFRRNRSELYVALKADHFLKLTT